MTVYLSYAVEQNTKNWEGCRVSLWQAGVKQIPSPQPRAFSLPPHHDKWLIPAQMCVWVVLFLLQPALSSFQTSLMGPVITHHCYWTGWSVKKGVSLHFVVFYPFDRCCFITACPLIWKQLAKPGDVLRAWRFSLGALFHSLSIIQPVCALSLSFSLIILSHWLLDCYLAGFFPSSIASLPVPLF